MSKRAVILAGGLGTRLYPYTLTLPKPLVPLGDTPILEIIIKQLKAAGFNHITLAVNHQADVIRAFCEDGARWGITIDYAQENEPLGTMAPLRHISNLPEHVLVMNGDILTNLDYAALYEAHLHAGAAFTIASYKRTHKVDYGVLETSNNRLTGFKEKPDITYEVSMGVYIVSTTAIAQIPAQGAFGFDQLMLRLIDAKTPVHIHPFDGEWLDIGRPDDYKQAIEMFESSRSTFLATYAV